MEYKGSFPAGAGFFLCHFVQLLSWCWGLFSLGLKQPGIEADHHKVRSIINVKLLWTHLCEIWMLIKTARQCWKSVTVFGVESTLEEMGFKGPLTKPFEDKQLPWPIPSEQNWIWTATWYCYEFMPCHLSPGSRLRPKTLQAVDVPVIDNRLCERWHKSNGINVIIYDEMMCAGYRGGGKDSCQVRVHISSFYPQYF